MNEVARKPTIECPAEVVAAGTALVEIRLLAERLESLIDEKLPIIRAGISHVVTNHGAANAQAGEALALLRSVQSAPGNVAHAHDVLRRVLVEKGIAEPTNKQIISALTQVATAEEKVAPDAEIESIR